MHTKWNRFTGSHDINNDDPQNDVEDFDVEAETERREDQYVDWYETYHGE